MTNRPNIEALAQEAKLANARARNAAHGLHDVQGSIDAANAAIDALAAQAAAVPQGWRLVPEEPQAEMIRAYREKSLSGAFNAEAYRALLSTAPPAHAPVEPSECPHAVPHRYPCEECEAPASPAPVAMPNVGEIEVRGVTYASVTWHSIVEAVKQRDVQWQAQMDARDRETAELRRKWLGHRDTGHLSLIEAADQVIGGLHAQVDALTRRLKTVTDEHFGVMERHVRALDRRDSNAHERDEARAELAALRSAPTDTKPLTGARIQKIWAEIAIGRDEPFVLKIDEFARAIYAIHAQTGAQSLTDEQILSGWGHADAIAATANQGPPHRALKRELETFTRAVRFAESQHGITGTPAADGVASK